MALQCKSGVEHRIPLLFCFLGIVVRPTAFVPTVVTKEDIAAIGSDGARLITAASDGDKATLNSLLKAGVDVNSRDWDDLTPLLAAANQNRLDMAALLIQKGADVTLKDKDGITAMMEAAMHGNVALMELLARHGGGVDDKTVTGVTPLWLAAGEGKLDVRASVHLSICFFSVFAFAFAI